jgi:hypothetical protein
MLRSKETIEVRSVSLYPADWAMADRVRRELGLSSLSAAIRHILRNWQLGHSAPPSPVNDDSRPAPRG